MSDSDALVFYTKLFRALEYDHRKAEQELRAELLRCFPFAGNSEDPVPWFPAHVPIETAMGWLMA